jgi:L-aminopeptidase/D-esterase-like protein
VSTSPLPVDHLADVAGLELGHHTLATRATGCSVVICREGAVASVDVRGGAPGTRETDLLAPDATVECIHAVLLTGGSAFGLDAAGGVMRWLEERDIGFKLADCSIPIVPAAVLFDLWHGDARARPDAAAGYAWVRARARPWASWLASGARNAAASAAPRCVWTA